MTDEFGDRLIPLEDEMANEKAELNVLSRVRSEFGAMPGMRLTLEQAVRLFGLPEDVCAHALHLLTDQGFLAGAPDRRFARRDVFASPPMVVGRVSPMT